MPRKLRFVIKGLKFLIWSDPKYLRADKSLIEEGNND